MDHKMGIFGLRGSRLLNLGFSVTMAVGENQLPFIWVLFLNPVSAVDECLAVSMVAMANNQHGKKKKTAGIDRLWPE